MKAGRVLSLDVFRGLTVAAMVLVNTPGSWRYVYWPLQQDNNGFLPNVASVFANVHQPGTTSNTQDTSANALLIALAPISLALFARLKSKRRR